MSSSFTGACVGSSGVCTSSDATSDTSFMISPCAPSSVSPNATQESIMQSTRNTETSRFMVCITPFICWGKWYMPSSKYSE